MNWELGMENYESADPQITQMGPDSETQKIICENLRMNSAPAWALSAVARRAKEETDKALKEILEKIGV